MGSCTGKPTRSRSLVAPTAMNVARSSSVRSKSMLDPNALMMLRKNYIVNEQKLHRRVKSCYESILSQRSCATNLNLKFVNLGPEGCTHLAAVLPHYHSIQTLCMWKTRMGIAGCEPIGKALAALTTLKVLSLEDNDIRAAGLERLSAGVVAIPGLEELYLHNNWLGPDGGLILAGILEKMQALCIVTADENSLMDFAAKKIIAALGASRGSITIIGLGFNSLTEETPQELILRIRDYPQLKNVRLGGTIATEEVRSDLQKAAPLVIIDY